MSKRTIPKVSARIVFALWIVTGAFLSAHAGDNPFLPVATAQLTVKAERSLEQFWRVRSAYLEESLKGATGYIEIENISGGAVKGADLYGEFYDAAGRFCFSLVFSLDTNVGKHSGPFRPKEVRKLYSTGTFLAPASQPVELRLFILRQDFPGAKNVNEAPPLRAPITAQINNPSDADRLRLNPEPMRSDGPVLDLALAEINVDGSSHIKSIKMISSASEDVRSWFTKFIDQQVFQSAMVGGVPESATTLVFLRAVNQQGKTSRSFLPANASPWVAQYVKRWSDSSAVPVLNEILFQRPPTEVKMGGSVKGTKLPPAPPGVFEPFNGSTDWCPEMFTLVPDPNSPNHYRRELATSSHAQE